MALSYKMAVIKSKIFTLQGGQSLETFNCTIFFFNLSTEAWEFTFTCLRFYSSLRRSFSLNYFILSSQSITKTV